jgi:26S proteasome regulatory subunit N12
LPKLIEPFSLCHTSTQRIMTEQATQLIQQLEQCVTTNNVATGKALLSQLKLALLTSGNTDKSAMIATLECGVLLSLAEADLDSFGRNMAQLKPYYPSTMDHPRQSLMIGLNLMHLLVENRLAEFHAELELLQEEDKRNIPHLAFPIMLEQQFMVGMYDAIMDEAAVLPNANYQIFMTHLVQTVRDFIADCLEVSYATLTVPQCATLMKFQTTAELQQYIAEYRNDWIVEEVQGGAVLTFQPIVAPTPGSSTSAPLLTLADIPNQEWIKQALTYATEMERII